MRHFFSAAGFVAGVYPMVPAAHDAYSRGMKKELFGLVGKIGLIVCVAALPILVGCVVEPGRSGMREHPSAGYAQSSVILEDDYVYYPEYETYYSSNRHRYVYQDGRNWVTRDAPPQVQANVLLASPSVHVDFHDAPAQHHAAVVKQYPRNWKPAEQKHEAKGNEPKDDKKDDHKDGR